MTAHVVLYRTRRPIGRQRWRFRCVAGNGRTLTVSSEAYTNRGDVAAERAAVVAWLRAEAGPTRDAGLPSQACGLENAATAVDRGDHLDPS